jgi:serine/threonine protein kinase
MVGTENPKVVTHVVEEHNAVEQDRSEQDVEEQDADKDKREHETSQGRGKQEDGQDEVEEDREKDNEDDLGEDNPMREVFEAIEDACNDVDKEPLARWQLPGLDDDFKDLVMRLTKLDPRKKITAQERLSHKWFRDI